MSKPITKPGDLPCPICTLALRQLEYLGVIERLGSTLATPMQYAAAVERIGTTLKTCELECMKAIISEVGL